MLPVEIGHITKLKHIELNCNGHAGSTPSKDTPFVALFWWRNRILHSSLFTETSRELSDWKSLSVVFHTTAELCLMQCIWRWLNSSNINTSTTRRKPKSKTKTQPSKKTTKNNKKTTKFDSNTQKISISKQNFRSRSFSNSLCFDFFFSTYLTLYTSCCTFGCCFCPGFSCLFFSRCFSLCYDCFSVFFSFFCFFFFSFFSFFFFTSCCTAALEPFLPRSRVSFTSSFALGWVLFFLQQYVVLTSVLYFPCCCSFTPSTELPL